MVSFLPLYLSTRYQIRVVPGNEWIEKKIDSMAADQVDHITNFSEDEILCLEKYLHKKTINSNLVARGPALQIPTIKDDALQIGRLLGKGQFCVVNEVNFIGTDQSDKLISRSHSKHRYPYVIKRISFTRDKNSNHLVNGMIDLAYEVHILSSLQHRNILSIEGLSSHEPREGPKYFVILSRLKESLADRIKFWRNEDVSPSHLGVFSFKRQKRPTEKLLERLNCLLAVASGIAYLHEQNVMHRDLKPDNVGFDLDGVVKIVDFGLAREYDPASRKEDGLFYNLTGKTGALFYMDPEVFHRRPYNELCDVFSFSILFWQLLTLTLPYYEYICQGMDMFIQMVEVEGKRPQMDPKWSKGIQRMLQDGWDGYANRPSMKMIHSLLQEEIQLLSHEETSDNIASGEYANPIKDLVAYGPSLRLLRILFWNIIVLMLIFVCVKNWRFPNLADS